MNAMEKLVALWPKGSGWKMWNHAPIWRFIRDTGSPREVHLDERDDDIHNAPARNIIEDALIQVLGRGSYVEVGMTGCLGGFASAGRSLMQRHEYYVDARGSRTEALLDLAVKVLEAHAPHP